MTDSTNDWINHLRSAATDAAEQWQSEQDRKALMRHAGAVCHALPLDPYMAIATLFLATNCVITGAHVNNPGKNAGPKLLKIIRELLDGYEANLPPDVDE